MDGTPLLNPYDLSNLPVVFRNMPEELYHRTHPVLSHSGMVKMLEECPAQFIYEVLNPAKRTDAMEFGDRYHTCILEPARFAASYAPLDAGAKGNTKAGIAQIEAIRAGGKEPIKFDDWATLTGMAAAISAHPIAGKLFARDGDRELSMFWTDPVTGVTCRIRVDFLPAKTRFVTDLKTAESASPLALSNSMANYGYYMQAALYEEGCYACDLRGPDATFVFVSQQKKAPYLVTCWVPDEESKQIGRKLVAKARRLFADCLRDDDWPAFASEVITVGLPRWFVKKFEAE